MKHTGIGLCIVVTLVLVANYILFGQDLLYFRITSLLIILIAFGWIGIRYDQQKRLSEKDFLTNTYTRRFAVLKFPLLSKKSETLFVYLLDLNNFKMINDQFGHDAGDQVLQQVAAILKKTAHHKTDIVARWGGDEFIVISQNIDSINFIKNIKEELKQFNQPAQLNVEFSIGKAAFPHEGKTLIELIKIADKNMYREKGAFRRSVISNEATGLVSEKMLRTK